MTSAGTPARQAQHWPALDGLRGVAVAGVVLFHLRPTWLPGGFLGVDLFFALSGFLITSLLVREAADTGAIELRAFWGRRFRRLLPAVMLVIAAVLAWTSIWGTPGEQAASRDDAAWAVPYLANWHLIDSARDYWASATAESPFTHLWSLAIEEQFYVVWPLLIWLLVRRSAGPAHLVAVTAGLAIASAVALVALYDPARTTRAYMGTDTRAFALLFGALFALEPIRTRVASLASSRGRQTNALAVALTVGLGIIWWYGGEHLGWLLGGGLIAHSFAAAALVCLLSLNAGPLAQLLGHRLLVAVGRLSYGIYLWHWPVISLGRSRLGEIPAALQDVILVAVSVALAAFSFRLVEHPIRRQLGWARGRRAAWATVAAAAVAVAAIVVSPTGRGHVAAFDAASIGVSAATDSAATDSAATIPSVTSAPVIVESSSVPTSSAPTTTETDTDTDASTALTAVPASIPSPTTPATAIPATTVPATSIPARAITRVLWIGDSVAADQAPAVLAALEAAGLEAVNGSFAARRLVSSDNVVAEELFPPVVTEAAADVVVVQLSSWDSPQPVDRQRASFQWFVDLVRSTGADLVFVTPPPFAIVDEGVARQIEVVHELSASDSGVRLIDSVGAWGSAFDVDIGDDGAPDRKPDGIHVCPQGAGRFAAWLVDELDRLYDGVAPAFPTAWAAGPWTTDVHYDTPVGACAALPADAG